MGPRSTGRATSCPVSSCIAAEAVTSSSTATGSTSRSSTGSHPKGSRIRRGVRRPRLPSTAATRRACSRMRVAATCCRRRRRTSSRSSRADCSSTRLTDWLALCRGAVEDVRGVLAELPFRTEREPVLSQGEGGDHTTAIDAAAERVILARFEGVDATIVSEEVGEVGSGRWRIVIDPIDGSLNAKRGIPFFSLSIAVADGETMNDVQFAYVYDFGTGEEWIARRGEGAFLNGEQLGDQRPKDRIELLAFEATLTSEVADK